MWQRKASGQPGVGASPVKPPTTPRNVWILKAVTEGHAVTEVTAAYTEKINWFKKGAWFLQAKFFGKKYTKSA